MILAYQKNNVKASLSKILLITGSNIGMDQKAIGLDLVIVGNVIEKTQLESSLYISVASITGLTTLVYIYSVVVGERGSCF